MFLKALVFIGISQALPQIDRASHRPSLSVEAQALGPQPGGAEAVQIDQIPAKSKALSERRAPGLQTISGPPNGVPQEVRLAWQALAAQGIVPSAENIAEFLGPETMIRLFGQPLLPIQVFSALGASDNGAR